MKRNVFGIVAVASVALMAQGVLAQCLETEANDTKATANPCVITAGGTIVGTSTSAAGAGIDYYRVKTAPLALGIYRHQLSLANPAAGMSATLRGLTQNNLIPNTPGTETSFQTSLLVGGNGISAWYGFGKEEEIHYRVTGAAATTTPYTATLTSTLIVPDDLGLLDVGPDLTGNLTLNWVGQTTTDTDMMILDSNLNPMAGYMNDDEPAGATLQSKLTRAFTPGVYYIAVSRFETASSLVSPEDDDFQTGLLAEFPNMLIHSGNDVGLDIDFQISIDADPAVIDTDGAGGVVKTIPAGNGAIYFAKFTVVPEPGSLALLAVGGLALIRRRRA